MSEEPLKIVTLLCEGGNNVVILTRMPTKEIIAEIQNGDDTRDKQWSKYEGLDDRNERVEVYVHRGVITGFIIGRKPQVQGVQGIIK